VALCQARTSTKPLWGFSSSNPYHSQSRAEHFLSAGELLLNEKTVCCNPNLSKKLIRYPTQNLKLPHFFRGRVVEKKTDWPHISHSLKKELGADRNFRLVEKILNQPF
jgi:hypothetical protein